MILVIWLALIGAIYLLIVLYFALNRIFFPANEEALQRLIACLKKPIKLQENEKQLLQFCTSQLTYGSTQHLYRLKNRVFCDFKMDVIKWLLNVVSCNFGLKWNLLFRVNSNPFNFEIMHMISDQIALQSSIIPLLTAKEIKGRLEMSYTQTVREINLLIFS